MKTKLIFSAIIIIGLFSQACFSQEKFENTITLDSLATSPDATLNDIVWIQGHWKGHAFGGETEEIWSPPLGGSMMCVFRLVAENKVVFYEIETITEENNTIILRLKHFGSDLKGWEEKDETVDFRLVKVTEDKVYFEGFTFERISKDEINMYVVIGHDDGSQEEVKFNYLRVQ